MAIKSFSIGWSETFEGGIFRVAPLESKRSATVNPQSAITESPGSTSSKRDERINNSLSEIHPPYNLDTNEIASDGVMQMSAFRVLWFLYNEKVNCCACGSEGA